MGLRRSSNILGSMDSNGIFSGKSSTIVTSSSRARYLLPPSFSTAWKDRLPIFPCTVSLFLTNKLLLFLLFKGESYNRKPRIETETSEEDIKNKQLLNRNEYQGSIQLTISILLRLIVFTSRPIFRAIHRVWLQRANSEGRRRNSTARTTRQLLWGQLPKQLQARRWLSMTKKVEEVMDKNESFIPKSCIKKYIKVSRLFNQSTNKSIDNLSTYDIGITFFLY